jgi:hypothetical protein
MLAGTQDFIGLNYYTTVLGKAGVDGPIPSRDRDTGAILTQDPNWPSAASSWLKVSSLLSSYLCTSKCYFSTSLSIPHSLLSHFPLRSLRQPSLHRSISLLFHHSFLRFLSSSLIHSVPLPLCQVPMTSALQLTSSNTGRVYKLRVAKLADKFLLFYTT